MPAASQVMTYCVSRLVVFCERGDMEEFSESMLERWHDADGTWTVSWPEKQGKSLGKHGKNCGNNLKTVGTIDAKMENCGKH